MIEQAPRGYRPRNVLRKGAKFGPEVLVGLVRYFCLGLSVRTAAKTTGLSGKTVRGVYRDFRKRLLKNRFNKWHRAGTSLVFVAQEEFQEAIRDAFFDVLSRCYFNRTCYRNFTAGNRKNRLCRSCPIPGRLKNPENVGAAIEFIDTVPLFYDRLGIGAEAGIDRVTLFKLRAAHTAVLIAVTHGTRKDRAGRLDFSDRSFLSFRTLFDALLADLIEEPL